MIRRALVLGLALMAPAGLAAGCGAAGESDAAPIDERRVRVTTTTNFITDTVRRIGGRRVEVSGLMGPGVDPHLYKASAGDVRTLRDADLILYGGLELEGKMADLLEELSERQTTQAVTADLPRGRLLGGRSGTALRHDPHVWFDVGLWRTAAGTVARALAAKDPGSRGIYERNLARFERELDRLDRYVRDRLAEIPSSRRVLVTSHDAFAYFGRRYDVEVAAIQGISTASEASTADVRRVAGIVADRDVRAIFVESSVPPQTIEAVRAAAREQGQRVEIGGQLYGDAAGDEGTPAGTYVGMIRANADTIAEGLR